MPLVLCIDVNLLMLNVLVVFGVIVEIDLVRVEADGIPSFEAVIDEFCTSVMTPLLNVVDAVVS